MSAAKRKEKHQHIWQRAAHTKPLIVIDSGHGGHDYGARYFSSDEKQLNLFTSHLVKKYLNNKGYRVMLTRNHDIFIPLKERAQLANQSKCAAFISIHYNSAPTKTASGIEVYYYHKGKKPRAELSKQLASHVIDKVIHYTGAKKRGVKSGNYCVIRETEMPAILIEGGFMTHPSESKQLKDQRYLDKLAKGIAEGIDRYFQSML